jgi:hypothetical protein
VISIRKAILTIFVLFMTLNNSAQGFATSLFQGNERARNMLAGIENVPITRIPGDQGVSLKVVSDDAGGGLITWTDEYLWNIYAQRFGANNLPLWRTNGIPVAPSQWYQSSVSATSDGEGGMIVSWVEGRGGYCGPSYFAQCDIYAQRIDPNGQPVWEAGGEVVVDIPENQGVSGIGIASDGNGGAILAWEDARQVCCRVFAQRIDANGQTKWIDDGIPIGPEVTIVIGPMDGSPYVVTDGAGGAIIAWINNQVDPMLGNISITVQRVDLNGNFLWALGGVPIGNPHWVEYSIIPDNAGGAIIAWSGLFHDNIQEIFAQRVSPDGRLLWRQQGVIIASGPFYRNNPGVVMDGAGNFIITWADERNGTSGDCVVSFLGNCDIYAQKINAAGQRIWQANGVPISLASGTQYAPRITSDGSNGAIIVWQDCRSYQDLYLCLPVEPSDTGMDLYTQRINESGKIRWQKDGTPVSKSDGIQGMDYGTNHEPGFVVTQDNVGGAIVVFPDGRNTVCVSSPLYPSNCDVYAQRINDHFAILAPLTLYLPTVLGP